MNACQKFPVFPAGIVLLILVTAAPAVDGAEEAPWQRLETAEMQMGTAFKLVVYCRDEARGRQALQAALARAATLNAILSDYDPDSELSRLSRASPTTLPLRVGDDLFRVLEVAQQISRQTEGAFDVTVGPLSRLWRRARRRQEMPSGERLREALAAVGYQAIELDFQQQTVSLRRPEMRLDLGGIAKGFAADEALRVLREFGFPRALANAGGDIVVGASPPGETGWTIGIEPLDLEPGELEEIVLVNSAIATSGDTWQYVEIEGRRYSHILDPRSGLGMTRRSSVTVLAPDGMRADAYASALSVMDIDQGFALLERLPLIEARIVWREDERLHQRRSAGFPPE